MTRHSDEFQTKEQALDDARASAAISHHLENERQSLKRQLAAANAEIGRLRAEVEDARVYITTDDGSKLHIRNLLRCGMRSLKRKRGVFWANVADAFGVGSTSAHRLCSFVLLDPDTGERTEDHPHA